MALIVDNINYSVGAKKIIDHVSFSCQRGQVHGLLGPNGAGKTTLFSLLMGLSNPQHGSIQLDNRNVTRLSAAQRVDQGLSFLPQESCLFEQMTALDNVIAALELRPSLPSSQHTEQALSLLSELNLEEMAYKKTHLLSGGQKRRLEFARLLACKPRYALLDEPFAGVDPLSISNIGDEIKFLCQKNIGVIISDHNVRETLKICDLATVLFEGRVLVTGHPEDVAQHELVQKNYLGHSILS